MAILADKNTKLLCQGLTGKQATIHAQAMLSCGTNLVGGVVPHKGGGSHVGLRVFSTVREARAETHATASIIFVPPPFAADAILEAALAHIELIIVITEGIPVMDMMRVRHTLRSMPSPPTLIGPNCPGIMTPPTCRMGIMPHEIFQAGSVGVVSRSGTLTYEAVSQLSAAGMGQSTCVGIGGDPIGGVRFTDCLQLFFDDDDTDAIFMVGEIGGTAEEEAAQFLMQHGCQKPVAAFIAGSSAPPGRRMGHAGAMISQGQGTANHKMEQLEKAGVVIASSAATMSHAMNDAIAAHNSSRRQ